MVGVTNTKSGCHALQALGSFANHTIIQPVGQSVFALTSLFLQPLAVEPQNQRLGKSVKNAKKRRPALQMRASKRQNLKAIKTLAHQKIINSTIHQDLPIFPSPSQKTER
ncbi:MAG: hypothetical protein K9J27_09010 [Bacteroidales bacterium]|nr:hypothetical protein [Bacteroidales bacterium]MCF8333855.1 hypothetical protein [Bacteroidales bacterium]